MAEQQHVARRDPVADLGLPHLAVQLVGDEHHHQVAAARRLDDRHHLEALLARRGDRGGVLAQTDDDVDAGVLQVQRVGMALRAVADDRDGLAVEQLEVGVVVVEHRGAQAIAHACADATRVRPGMASVPSAAA